MSASRAIVLAAGVGKRFGKMTRRTPKCLIPIGRTNLLRRYLDAFRETGIRDVVLVVGHEAGQIRRECRRFGRGLRIRFISNKNFRRGSVVSLHCAGRHLNCNVLVMDADVFFPAESLEKLHKSRPSSAFLTDPRSKSTGEEMMLMAKKDRLFSIAKKIDPSLKIVGEATGIVKFSKKDAARLKEILAGFIREKILDVEYEEAYARLMKEVRLGVVPVEGFWSEMDFEADRKKILRHVQFTSQATDKRPTRRIRRRSR